MNTIKGKKFKPNIYSSLKNLSCYVMFKKFVNVNLKENIHPEIVANAKTQRGPSQLLQI